MGMRMMGEMMLSANVMERCVVDEIGDEGDGDGLNESCTGFSELGIYLISKEPNEAAATVLSN